MHSAFAIVMVLIIGSAPSVIAMPLNADADLDELRIHALEHNEAVRAADLQVDVLGSQRASVTALPDPKLGLAWMLVPVETRVGPQRQSLSLTQRIPWFGSLGARGGIVDGKRGRAEARLRAVALNQLLEVDRNWAELAWLAEAIRISGEHLELMNGWEEVARNRYASGEGDYADLIRSQLEIDALSSRLEELEQRRPVLMARLAAAVGVESLPESWSPADLPESVVVPDEEQLLERMLADSPELAALEGDLVAARAGIDVARLRGRPDFTVGLDWVRTDPSALDIPDNGKDPVILRLSADLPLWRGAVASEVKAARASEASVAAVRADTRRQLEAELAETMFAQRDALRRHALYHDELLPGTRQALETVTVSYASGRSGFLDLIDLQRRLLEFEQAAARAAADGVVGRARLESLVGGAVDRAPMIIPRLEASTE